MKRIAVVLLSCLYHQLPAKAIQVQLAIMNPQQRIYKILKRYNSPIR